MCREEPAVQWHTVGLQQSEQSELWGLPLWCKPISCHFSCSAGRPSSKPEAQRLLCLNLTSKTEMVLRRRKQLLGLKGANRRDFGKATSLSPVPLNVLRVNFVLIVNTFSWSGLHQEHALALAGRRHRQP